MPIVRINEKRQFFVMLENEFKNSVTYELPITEIYEPLHTNSYFEVLVSSPYKIETIKQVFLINPEWKSTFYRFTNSRKKSNSLICRMGRMMKILQTT